MKESVVLGNIIAEGERQRQDGIGLQEQDMGYTKEYPGGQVVGWGPPEEAMCECLRGGELATAAWRRRL